MKRIMKMKHEEIIDNITNGNMTISVIGLGWMGLPTACLFAEAGAKVIGVDTNQLVVDSINSGISHLPEPEIPELLKKHIQLKRLKATTDTVEAVSQSDVVVILVPILIDSQKKPDYSNVYDACKKIGKGLKEDSLIIFESTCAPGVTERIVKPTIEKYSGLKACESFGLAYSPIRAMSGRALNDIQNYTRILGASDEKSLEVSYSVLSTIVKGRIMKVSNIKTAEASKLFEVIYRDVNIALANEFAITCETIGIDYIEVMKAANSQPYSHLHIPGVGVGGHCLPVYPYLLLEEAKMFDIKLRLIKEARRMNEGMPKHTLRLIANGLRACGKTLKRSKVTILGIAYRANVKEVRFSPSIELINLLKRRGVKVTAYDPNYNFHEIEKIGINSKPTFEQAIEGADVIVITVAHDEFKNLDLKKIALCLRKPSLIVDCAHLIDPKEAESNGLIYRGVGRGVWTN
ncbi:MAG: nucleotide sugar dehydrogenase [Candidatus Bathyarchaeia archaeon]